MAEPEKSDSPQGRATEDSSTRKGGSIIVPATSKSNHSPQRQGIGRTIDCNLRPATSKFWDLELAKRRAEFDKWHTKCLIETKENGFVSPLTHQERCLSLGRFEEFERCKAQHEKEIAELKDAYNKIKECCDNLINIDKNNYSIGLKDGKREKAKEIFAEMDNFIHNKEHPSYCQFCDAHKSECNCEMTKLKKKHLGGGE